jgi:heme oxygenase
MGYASGKRGKALLNTPWATALDSSSSGLLELAEQAKQILERAALPSLSFWVFERPLAELKAHLHDGFEELQLSEQQELELLEEADAAFQATQRLLAELTELG